MGEERSPQSQLLKLFNEFAFNLTLITAANERETSTTTIGLFEGNVDGDPHNKQLNWSTVHSA